MKLGLLAMILSLWTALKEDARGVIDLGVILMIGIAFAGLVVIGFIIWRVVASLRDTMPTSGSGKFWLANNSNHTMTNITTGFDSAVALILVAITIFVLALAISALLLLRQR